MDTSFLDLILDKIGHLEGMTAYITIFSVLLACGIGLPMPEDITLFAAGYLAYLGNIHIGVAIVVCFFGVLIGDIIIFMAGKKIGMRFFTLPGVRFVLTPERVAFAKIKLQKNSKKVCFAARFIAGLRAPIFFTAGMLGVKPMVFLTLDSLAALVSVPLLTYVGFYFGEEIEIGLHYMRRGEKYIMIGLALVGLFFVIKYFVKKSEEI